MRPTLPGAAKAGALNPGHRNEFLSRFSQHITERVGSSWAFAIALGIIVIWGTLGPLFHFSDTWQLVINTGTTIVTFLMVFLIQRSQNKESLAIQLKLNELVAAIHGASNRLVGVEDLSEDELHVLKDHYTRLARAAAEEAIGVSHSVERALNRHARKKQLAGESRPAVAAQHPLPAPLVTAAAD